LQEEQVEEMDQTLKLVVVEVQEVIEHLPVFLLVLVVQLLQ
jgi:hypothetical protein